MKSERIGAMTKCTCGVGLLLTIGPNNFPRQDPKIFSQQDTKIGDYPDFRSLNMGKAQGRRNLRLPVEKRAYVQRIDMANWTSAKVPTGFTTLELHAIRFVATGRIPEMRTSEFSIL